jgi:hypothetical protein
VINSVGIGKALKVGVAQVSFVEKESPKTALIGKGLETFDEGAPVCHGDGSDDSWRTVMENYRALFLHGWLLLPRKDLKVIE